MKNGIFFLTYDGYYNFTSGIGTQTKTFLKGIEMYYQEYCKIYGEFEINNPVAETTGYGCAINFLVNPFWIDESNNTTEGMPITNSRLLFIHTSTFL